MKRSSLTVIPSFLSELPELRSVQLEGEHFSRLGGGERHRVCYVKDVPSYIPCSNSDCEGEGYHIAAIITKLVKDRRTFYAREWVCDGCSNAFYLSLSLTYRDDPAELGASQRRRARRSVPLR